MLRDVRGQARSTVRYRSDILAVAGDPQGNRYVIDMADAGWSALDPQSFSDFHLYDFMRTERRHGPWALSRHTIGLKLVSINEGYWDRTVDQDRALVVAYLLSNREITDAESQLLASSDLRTSRILWPGLIENTLVAISFALLLLSLSWLSPAWWRTRRAQHRLRRHHCPACNYSLRGLASATCPECGQPIPATTSDTRVEIPNSTRL
jgi:hypothetical protein